MKYLIIILLLVSSSAFSQSKYYIRADSTQLEKVGGNNELIMLNGTRSKTGAYLKNTLNGRTGFFYAIDSAYISGSNLVLVRGGGTQNITVPVGSTVTPAALTRTDDTNVTLTLTGTPSTALLQAVGLGLGWTGDLAFSRLTQIPGLSVLGVTGGSTADVAGITGTNDQFLRVRSGALGFGSIVAGDLPPTSPYTWQQTLTAGSTLTGANAVSSNNDFIWTADQVLGVGEWAINGSASKSLIGSNGGINAEVGVTSGYSVTIGTGHASTLYHRSDIEIWADSILLTPYLGSINIDTLKNLSGQNALMGWDSTGSDRGQVGYVTLGGGLSMGSGVLSSSTVATTVPISGLTAATGTNTIDNGNYLQTWQFNSLAGTGMYLLGNSTAAAGDVQQLMSLILAGANSNSTQRTRTLSISNQHTGTASTNVALELSATSGTNNHALIVQAGSVGIGTSTPSALQHNVSITEQLRIGYDLSNYYSTTINSTGNATLNLVGTTPEFTFSDAVNVPDDAYAVGWDGNTEVPTKNALYDKIQSLPVGTVTGTGTTNELAYWTSSTAIGALPVATYPSLTELSYGKGVTSAIQTQINLKAPLASPTFTGTVTIPTPFTLGAVSVLPTGTELNFVDGVTSTIQTQIDSKQATITFGTGVQAALGVNIGSAGAPVLFNGAGGTPSSLVLTSATGLPPATGIVGWPANASGVLTNNGSGTLSWGAGGGGGTTNNVTPTARLATAAALPANTYLLGVLTGGSTGTLTVDGVVTAVNDIILVKNEAAGANNGLYTVTTAGAIGVAYILTRHTSQDVTGEFVGAVMPIASEGTANKNTEWRNTNATAPTVGTTAITNEIQNIGGCKKYVALLTQTSTNAPVATVLENTLGGTVVWTRDNAGEYTATLASAFTSAKTIVLISNSPNAGTGGYFTFLTSGRTSDNTVIVNVFDITTQGFVDGQMTGASIRIEVYY